MYEGRGSAQLLLSLLLLLLALLHVCCCCCCCIGVRGVQIVIVVVADVGVIVGAGSAQRSLSLCANTLHSGCGSAKLLSKLALLSKLSSSVVEKTAFSADFQVGIGGR